MKCPKCGQDLRVLTTIAEYKEEGHRFLLLLGRCVPCNFDGTWERDENGNEEDLKRYFFG